MSRLDRPTLIALFIVDRARQAAANGRLPRTHALRLALAWLFASSDGQRAPYDRFWRSYADDFVQYPRPVDALNQRNAELAECWTGILQSLGLPHAPDLEPLDSWQERENRAVLSAAIGEHRRAKAFAKDARECFSPNGHSIPKLVRAKG